MGNILYIMAIVLVVGWAIGFLGYAITGIIHLLLVMAIIAVLLGARQGNLNKQPNNNNFKINKP